MRIYAIYDSLACEYVSCFLSSNFETAKRSVMDGLSTRPDVAPHESFLLVRACDPDNCAAYPHLSPSPATECISLLNLYRQCVRVVEDNNVAS